MGWVFRCLGLTPATFFDVRIKNFQQRCFEGMWGGGDSRPSAAGEAALLYYTKLEQTILL